MLVTRVIPTMLHRDRRLYKGRQFANDRCVGTLMATAEVYMMRQVDELVLLNLGDLDLCIVSELGDICTVPLTVGGGIHTTEDVRAVLANGADKVIVPHALVEDVSRAFGAQAAIVTLDVIPGMDVLDTAKRLEDAGAGEIVLQSVSRDGMMCGYDTEAIALLAAHIRVPIVASSGAGDPSHMLDAIDAGADAVAAGAMWQFTHHTPRTAKVYLKDKGVHVRLKER